MGYPSIDKLQQTLAKEVFHYAKDSKKAAGRALGTLIEVITFYLLKDWGFEENARIEKGLVEYRNAPISHNVEYTIHPIKQRHTLKLALKAPTTATKILMGLEAKGVDLKDYTRISSTLYTTSGTKKNACVIARSSNSSLVATIKRMTDTTIEIDVTEQVEKPYAMIECKRVGVEEGNKKGPQTIEKAKQGAYVARMVSCLQKVRSSDGTVFGVLPTDGEAFTFGKYDEMLKEIITSNDQRSYRDFILTVGVVSNHGNWFTSENPNKELVVLSDAYDWLLFLTDEGIAMFIDELLLNPRNEYRKIQRAFLASYDNGPKQTKKNGRNQFTKSQMNSDADLLLQQYFSKNRIKIESWINILVPSRGSISDLRAQLKKLDKKNWHNL